MNNIHIAIAGSTTRTVQCAQILLNHPRFTIPWILTPTPKAIGRKKTVTKNTLHLFAEKNNLPIFLVKKKIDRSILKAGETYSTPDILLVVDFGYIIPQWLLKLPLVAALNIHPSNLPRWRGSSPGQFVLLSGDKKSAVTIMVMNEKIDQGSILHKEHFEVKPDWNQTDYYQHSFDLICSVLPQQIIKFHQGKLKLKSQPVDSPTPLAKKLSKKDSFVNWKTIQKVLSSPTKDSASIERACRAYYPWPLLWTKIPTQGGKKRMQILQCHLDPQTGQLVLDKVKIEGLAETSWNQVKNTVT